MAETSKFDVIVVGGGLSGLVCAYNLSKKGRTVLVLEATDRIGGRMWTVHTQQGHEEAGAMFVGPSQKLIMSLINELDIDIYPQYLNGRKAMSYDGKTATFKGLIPPASWWSLIDTQLVLWKIDRLAQTVPLDCPWKCDNVEVWDGMTVQHWVDSECWFRTTKLSVELAVAMIFGAQTRDLSMLYFLYYVHAAGGLTPLIEVKGGAQESKIVGGAQQICEKLAAFVRSQRPCDVRCGEPVASISDDAGSADGSFCGMSSPAGEDHEHPMQVATLSGRVYRARTVVVAIPPTLCRNIAFSPSLPVVRQQLCDRVFMGAYTKAYAVYDRPFWREGGFSGEAYSLTPTFDCPVLSVYDGVSADGDSGAGAGAGTGAGMFALVCFITGDIALHFGALSPDEQQRAVLRSLAAFFGPRALASVCVHVYDWSKQRWVEGCPVNVFPPGSFGRFAGVLREPAAGGRLRWAGTETATGWTGYMDGAVEAGSRAAEEALDQLAPVQPVTGGAAVVGTVGVDPAAPASVAVLHAPLVAASSNGVAGDGGAQPGTKRAAAGAGGSMTGARAFRTLGPTLSLTAGWVDTAGPGAGFGSLVRRRGPLSAWLLPVGTFVLGGVLAALYGRFVQSY